MTDDQPLEVRIPAPGSGTVTLVVPAALDSKVSRLVTFNIWYLLRRGAA